MFGNDDTRIKVFGVSEFSKSPLRSGVQGQCVKKEYNEKK
jgi:hypothetical protein